MIFIMEMKMDMLMENEFGKRLDYNEWMMRYKINLITKNEFNI